MLRFYNIKKSENLQVTNNINYDIEKACKSFHQNDFFTENLFLKS